MEGFGGKFIGVEQGATLELHGQNKLGWTKITSTIPKITFDNGLVYDIHVRPLPPFIIDTSSYDIHIRPLLSSIHD